MLHSHSHSSCNSTVARMANARLCLSACACVHPARLLPQSFLRATERWSRAYCHIHESRERDIYRKNTFGVECTSDLRADGKVNELVSTYFRQSRV